MSGSFREIRIFVAAYEELSFTAAAEREHATQSGVSQHIRSLESRCGVKLFLREKGKVTPSEAGHCYYLHCIGVLRSHEEAMRSMKGFSEGLTGEIVVGLMPTMTRCTLTPALTRFIEIHPNTTVRIVEGYSARLTELVKSGEVDFAIVPAIPGVVGLRSRLFLRTPEIFASGSSEYPDFKPLRLPDLGPLRLVFPSKGNTRRQTLETYCSTNGIEISRMIELDTMFGTLDFVARTDWSAILPAILIDPRLSKSGFNVHPIVDPGLSLDMVLIEPSRKPLAPAAEAFYDILHDIAVEINELWLAMIPATDAKPAQAAKAALRE